ncbi:MAG: hypothetical protein V7L04_31730 [Nostoc sp.]|uniref:hypothetical protein n=1 Tax=Nostoc sp. TaxID=1180 RepID=UPI002FF8BD0C
MPVFNTILAVPTEVRNQVADGDCILMVTSDGTPYKIKIADLLANSSINSTTGGSSTTSYPAGMALWLDNGSLTDKSGNNRNASPIGVNSPSVATGIDDKQVLRWDGTGRQELQIPPFLSNTTGATLYCVCTINGGDNYNLVRTFSIDDYWKFVSVSGYFGTFRNSRYEGYPSGMPSTGNHLISIHASATDYEVVVDTISKGVQQSSYVPGDRFRIGVNDKVFNGDIALLLVYPQYTQPGSTSDLGVRSTIKSIYPSLPFS